MPRVRKRSEPKHGTIAEYSTYGCRCDLCRGANRLMRRASDLRRSRGWAPVSAEDYAAIADPTPFKVTRDAPRHGTASEYTNHRCRCEPCRTANREAMRRTRRRRQELVAAHPELIRHGTRMGYNPDGCRCDACCAANREAARRWRRTPKHPGSTGRHGDEPSHA